MIIICAFNFNITSYAIDVASIPSVKAYGDAITALSERFANIPACSSFLNATKCLLTYIPCNFELSQLVPICENDCAMFSRGVMDCLLSNQLDFIEFTRFSAAFNCSNPGRYLPDIPYEHFAPCSYCQNNNFSQVWTTGMLSLHIFLYSGNTIICI